MVWRRYRQVVMRLGREILRILRTADKIILGRLIVYGDLLEWTFSCHVRARIHVPELPLGKETIH